jgi:hypothetical protein
VSTAIAYHKLKIVIGFYLSVPLADFLGFLSFSRAILVGDVIAVHKRFNVPAVPNIFASEFPESSDKDECPSPNKVCLSSPQGLNFAVW